jgi:predicted ATPase
MPVPNHITRVVLENYKSLRECDVSLGWLTFLVGPNGAGKSNFVEALRFLSFALSSSLEQALEARSGFRSIIYKGSPLASRMSFEIFFQLGSEARGSYLVQLGAGAEGRSIVIREECSVRSSQGEDWFKVHHGVVTSNQGLTPAASEDRLYLVNASGLPPFESVYRALSSIAVYNPVPDEIRGFKPEKRYRHLDRAGSALAETIFRLKTSAPERLSRAIDYLRKIAPSVLELDAVSVEGNYHLRFELESGFGIGENFPPQNISDGTLRALAILVALFQVSDRYPLTLIGLEEPEAGLHPAGAGVLFDSLVEASHFGQILVTSHSPDLLDRDDIPEGSVQAVEMCAGRTIIGRVDSAGQSALKDRLYTTGELMRMNQLRPEGVADCADVR